MIGDEPCARCGLPHKQTSRGYYAGVGKERHAYEPPVVVATVVIRPGFRSDLKMLPPVACDRCHCMVANDRTREHAEVVHP